MTNNVGHEIGQAIKERMKEKYSQYGECSVLQAKDQIKKEVEQALGVKDIDERLLDDIWDIIPWFLINQLTTFRQETYRAIEEAMKMLEVEQ